MKPTKLLSAIFTSLLVATSFAANAQEALVTPNINYIGKNTQFSTDKTAIFYLKNNNGEKRDLVSKITVQKWTVDESGEKLQNTDDFSIHPPIKNIKHGEIAVYKLIFKGQRTDVQQTYRISATTENNKVYDMGNMKVLIPVVSVIPLFVEPTTEKKVELTHLAKNGEFFITNNGNTSLRIPAIQVNDKEILSLTYILPKSTIKVDSKAKLEKILELSKIPENIM